MSTTTVAISVAAAGAALVMGTICAAPASAITFTFSGNFLTNGSPFAGSATFEADFLKNFAKEAFVGDNLELKSSNPMFDPNGSISLTVQSDDSGNISTSTVSSLGLSLTPYVAANGFLALGRGFTTKIPGYTFAMSLPPSCIKGDFTTCTGALFNSPSSPDAYRFPLVPVSSTGKPTGSKNAAALQPTSVPEPTGAIAVSLTSALMLMRRKKKILKQCA